MIQHSDSFGMSASTSPILTSADWRPYPGSDAMCKICNIQYRQQATAERRARKRHAVAGSGYKAGSVRRVRLEHPHEITTMQFGTMHLHMTSIGIKVLFRLTLSLKSFFSLFLRT